MKSFVLATVKSVAAESESGEFEAVLSAETLDRDGEVIKAGAFEPLPEAIPMHAFHDFRDPVGVAHPYYEDGVLKARGRFASTARAQEIRTLVADGIIGHTSVGFMAADRSDEDGVTHITRAELLEASFVSVPSNRQAAILAVKDAQDAISPLRQTPDSTAPATPSDEDGKSLASVVEAYRVIAGASLLLAEQ